MRKPLSVPDRLAVYRPIVAVVLLLVTVAANAHQQKESVTRILFNARTGSIEVMHRFLVHDAEHAVKKMFGTEADILGSDASRERFATYVHEQFRLRDDAGNDIALTPVGHEIDGRFVWVYAEAPARDDLTSLTLVHDALRELWPDQVNLVNIDREGQTTSALLAGNEREVTLKLR